MADGSPRPPLYRSVSFKLLERWSGGPGPSDEDADTPALRRRTSCRPATAAPVQPSRRVSKLASGPPAAPAQPRPLRSLSPSVRQLSRRFDAARLDGAAGARDGGVSPGSAEEAAEGAARGAWPSVTEMRKLFGGPSSRRPSADSEAPGTTSPDGASWERPARDPRQPPTPPPRTCFPLAGLRSARSLSGPGIEGRRRRQQQPQERAQRPADGLHSWHSFSQPQAGARASCYSSSSSSYPVSRSPAASSSEEEEEGPQPQPGAQSPAYLGGHSSGSDEDRDGEGSHRWRESGLRPGSSLLDQDCNRDSDGLNPGSVDSAGGVRSPEPPTSPRASMEEGPRDWGTGSLPCVSAQEGLRPMSDTVGGAFRVAKVSFPAYLASPAGSRGSSRYSSTETLKDDDLWSSRSSGSWGVYRSPSFGTGEGLLLRPQIRSRPKGPVGTTRVLRDGGLELDKNRQRKSLSNPDIASETLTLLSFLRSDLSELRVRKPSGGPGSSPRDGRGSPSAGSPMEQVESMPSQSPASPTTRPTLKDLTATLRRAKSFSCSEKPMARRLLRTSALKPSSSELLLAASGTEEDPLPLVVQDQYVQEARQVFEKIQRMGAQQDDGSDAPPRSPDWTGNTTQGQPSQEELSGPDSSLTDEGIGADPEPLAAALCSLDSAGVWRPLSSTSTQTNHRGAGTEDSLGGWSLVSPETPPTPGALRRRRKVPPSGPGGTELSNGEAGEAYRSLSDPIPQRRRAATSEEPSGFSVDSNFLGSLNSKTGLLITPAMDDGLTSGHSDWSVVSEESKGYQEVMESIVQGPGALGRGGEDRVAGKAPKKKSLSDPSRRGELARPEFEGPGGEPIREVEPLLPPSSSEPILAEQWAEPEEPGPTRGRAQSERALPVPPASSTAHCDFCLDPKLTDVLSPRLTRRGSKKRPARSSHQELRREEGNQDQTGSPSQARSSSKHVRHASVPATFTPIVPEPSASVGPPVAVPEPVGFSTRAHPTFQAPSLEDVTKQYMLTLHSSEIPASGPVDLPCLPLSALASVETKPPEVARAPEEPAPASKCCSKPQVDMRKHVTMTLLDTEQSYVESLRTLMQGYMQPLKQPENSVLCDPSLVDEIFDQIPELLEHHEQFLEQVRHCVQTWHAQQKVGALLVQSFSKDVLVNIYSAYIDNFLNAKDAVRVAKEARPAFLKFLEQSMRENKEKQALSDLMIKPVQRIPRYELLVKDLLKHTPEDHPDHPLLLDAQRNIKQVAERINKGVKSAEEAERHARVLQEIEAHIEGMEDLQAPLRRFLRQEMVTELKAIGGKKDRSLFLFTDLIVCTTLKRKSGSLRRSSMSLYTAASVIDTASKYKMLWKLPLEDTDIIKGASQATNRENIQKAISRLDEDLATLSQMSKLSENLGFPHQSLDDALRDLSAAMHRDLSEKQALCYSLSFPPTKLELCATRPEGTDSYIFEFPHPDARLGFEQAFDEAKRKLASSKSCLDPEFLKAIPIMKTRSGMQFSCAAPTLSSCPEPAPEVWVCNSDGYVGQVCLLSLRAEPDVEACIAVCSARILCIGAVPGLQPRSSLREQPESLRNPPDTAAEPAGPELEMEATAEEEAVTLAEPGPQPYLHISISGSGLEMAPGLAEGEPRPELVPFDSDSDDESSPSPSGTLQSQASQSTISSSFGNEETPSSKEATAETTSSEEEQEPGFLPLSGSFGPGGPCGTSPMDGRALRRSSRGSFTRGSLEDLLNVDPEAYQSSVWLGTEDGCVHVYQSSDSIRDRRNSMKLQHAASVTCILYLNNQVFVSLANGELVVYQREPGRFWDPQNFKSLTLGAQGSPITKMVSVGGRLWCGCQNRVLVLSPDTLQLEHTFYVGQDSSRSVACMADSSLGVWVTLRGSAHVCLYHSDTFEQLAEVDVTPPVHRMLAGSDAIIRQHKAACLRITALLVCEELLWVGTSAGVVLTVPTSPGTVSCPRAPLSPAGLGQGHTGHVRFLAAVQLPDGFNLLCPTPPPPPDTGPEKLPSLDHRDSPHHRGPASTRPQMLVISGGDGYEDFRLSSGGGGSSETVGRDDSTNHLLLWRL